ncbi:hypothetical protein BDR07DRAFT_1447547 [Suillus spraguei]|nr:hypothetical protein BDR07DRAFT_1447547 [Suillus spraguei]
MSCETSLNQLSVETRAKLRSAQLLTSLPQVVSELLQNSLDAGASQVDIGVDCEEWSCWVRDNGAGISKAGLTMIGKGSEEGRYTLSSMAELCCLEISSRTSQSPESWSVILKGGKFLYSGPSIRWRRETAGTVVCVRDAFYSLPIRRQSHPSSAKTIDAIKQELEAYALMFPCVSFTLQDDSKSRENASSKGHVLRIPKTRSILAAFRHMYGRALTEHVEEIDATLEICFPDINKHPISFCDLHRLIDNKFSNSTFLKHVSRIYVESLRFLNRKVVLNSVLAVRRSPRKGEKKPIYVLNLVIPTRLIDNCLEPAKSAVQIEDKNAVTTFLSSVIDSFLIRHSFASDPDSAAQKNVLASRKAEPNEARAVFIHPVSSREPIIKLWYSVDRNQKGNTSDEIPKTMVWEDPGMDEMFIVNAPTGNSHSIDGTNTASVNRVSRIPRPMRKGGPCSGPMPDWLQEALIANNAYSTTQPKIPSLSLFSNQASDDQGCAVVHSNHPSCCAPPFGTPFHKGDLLKAQVINQVDRKFIACLVDLDHSTHGQTPKNLAADGSTLILIDQHAADERVRVERFLTEICSGFLQHCEGTGGVEVSELSPAVPILLTRHEASRLAAIEEVQSAFDRWGVRFDGLTKLTPLESECEASDGYVQVFVRAIPAIVGDKLLMNDELQDLVKGYLGTLESEGAYPPNLSQHKDVDNIKNDESRWLKALRWCPRELLDLINSKACRGAVMFNDPLSLEQCERLVRHLAATAFPFQCAHGRLTFPRSFDSCKYQERQAIPTGIGLDEAEPTHAGLKYRYRVRLGDLY